MSHTNPLNATIATPTQGARRGPSHICMHVRGVARTDARVMREATALVQAGFAVSIVDIERDASRPREEMMDGVRLKHIVMPANFVSARFKPWFLVKAARSFFKGSTVLLGMQAEVYHAHDFDALPACYVAARLRRKRLVFDAHELPLVQPHLIRWRRLHRLAVGLLRAMLPRCTATITVSPPLVEEMQRLYGGPRAVVVRNLPVYQPPISSDQLRQRLGLAPQTRIALYQGGIQDNRSLDMLVHAAKYLAPGHMIVLMGNGPLQNMLATLIEQEGVGDRVKMLPAVPYAELLSWTASADLGLIIYDPNHSLNVKYCLPNKLFEYLMAGVPVLTSPLPATFEVVRTYHAGGMVDSLEPAVVGHAISVLLADGDGLAQMRRNALAAAQHDLHWQAEQGRLVRLYQDHLGLRRVVPEAASVARLSLD